MREPSELKENTVEIHMKLKGVHYALGLKLEDFPSEDKLVRGLKVITQCLRATLVEQKHWEIKT